MKANEAPEKLYIALDEFTEDERTFVLDHRVDYPICTEYIRTDAFIEKACEWLKDNASNYVIEHLFSSEVDFKEDKMIEDYRNYMKGKEI